MKKLVLLLITNENSDIILGIKKEVERFSNKFVIVREYR